jgi:cyclopropane fatty-acyl-phospholipid synthase-like methyltransferase
MDPAYRATQNSKLEPRLRALGFGCGKEPIPKWLADRRVSVIATDAPGINPAWDHTNQRAHSLEDLGIEDDNGFVEFREVDMNSIPDDLLQGEFNFTWSCGSFEHIGGISKSLEFFCKQMRCLRPGGIACHTTELNTDLSARETIDSDNLVLFRSFDIATLAGMLWQQGDRLWYPDFRQGDTEIDLFVDSPPYTAPYHLNISVGRFTSTSIVLIATRGDNRS